jgi:hypothetical protein
MLSFLSFCFRIFQAAEQRVKDCLHDQMLLHHQIQVLEEEALSSKAAITRLTRELEDRKFLRSGREDKDRWSNINPNSTYSLFTHVYCI